TNGPRSWSTTAACPASGRRPWRWRTCFSRCGAPANGRTTILDFNRSIVTILCMAKKREKLSDQIRRGVDASSVYRYRICKTLGLAEATMSRFMNGQGGLSMAHFDALADLLDLNITLDRKLGPKKGK